MKHIKYFSSINESYQDGIEIIDAIRNTPEGRDLQKLLMTYGLEFESVFELKRSGRVYLIRYGSKTYMERTDRGDYVITSLSNSVPFWTERYPNIQQLLRGAFINHVSKRMSGSGIKKEAVSEWVSGNITPGSEMDLDQIKGMYNSSTGVEYLDIEEVENLPVIKNMKLLFPNLEFTIMHGKIAYGVLRIDFSESIFGNPCRFRYRTPLNMTIHPQTNEGKNSLSYDKGIIKLKKSEDLNSLLSKYISKYIRHRISDIEQYGHNFIEGNPNECWANDLIISWIESSSLKDVKDTRSLVEKYLEEIANRDSVVFSRVITELLKMDNPELNDVYKRVAEKYATLVRGGSIVRRFGSNFT